MNNNSSLLQLVACPLEYELKHRRYEGNTKNLPSVYYFMQRMYPVLIPSESNLNIDLYVP